MVICFMALGHFLFTDFLPQLLVCEADASDWRWRLFLKDTAHMMQKPGNGLQENRLVRLLRSPFLILLAGFLQLFSQLHGFPNHHILDFPELLLL